MSVIDSSKLDDLVVTLTEAARADETGIGRFIEPAEGTLRRALSNRHHLIFGRRGSGKTSLLQKARAELVAERRPNAFIDMEKFKAHSYPDVLISVLIETLGNIGSWLSQGAVAPANRTSFWQRVRPRRRPLSKTESERLAGLLKTHVDELKVLLHAQDGASIELLSRGESQSTAGLGAKLAAGIPVAPVSIEGGMHSTSTDIGSCDVRVGALTGR